MEKFSSRLKKLYQVFNATLQVFLPSFSFDFFLPFFKRHFQWCMWICCSYIERRKRSQHRKKHANWYWKWGETFSLVLSPRVFTMFQCFNAARCFGDAARCFGERFAFVTGKTFGADNFRKFKSRRHREVNGTAVFSLRSASANFIWLKATAKSWHKINWHN